MRAKGSQTRLQRLMPSRKEWKQTLGSEVSIFSHQSLSGWIGDLLGSLLDEGEFREGEGEQASEGLLCLPGE